MFHNNQIGLRINDNTNKKLRELLKHYREQQKDDDEDLTFYSEAQIIRIAIHRLHKQIFDNEKKI